MKNNMILPGATIGILGSGQLGRMLAIEASRMGYKVAVLSPDRNSPTSEIADHEVIGLYEEEEAVRAFAQYVDVVTFEFENVPAFTLEVIEGEGKPVRPGRTVLRTSQDRLMEKVFLDSIGCSTPPFAAITDRVALAGAVGSIGVPAILKTSRFGYDGKGQRVIRSAEEAMPAWETLGRVPCVYEALIDFAFEASVVAARGVDGSFVHYGLVQNEHLHHILDVTTTPTPTIPQSLVREAIQMTRSILEQLEVVGVLTVEFFITKNGRVLVNEIAPRPHNSGHFTIDACATSQFGQQLRAVCGLPLGDPTQFKPAAMANLLGDLWGPGEPDWSTMFTDFPDVRLHLYGKERARSGRKMGHLTVLAETSIKAAERVRAARAAL